MGYATPDTLSDAVACLGSGQPSIVAGGTDFFPALGDRPAPADILDISRIAELGRITRSGPGCRIGAAVRWRDIIKADLPAGFDALKLAAREVGSLQIQNAGTVAGNLCNASPAADGVPPLLTLEARVELASASGRRELALAEFITGVRKTALKPGEMVSAILIPPLPAQARGHFLKLGARKYLVISIAMVSAVTWLDTSGAIAGARVAVGSCSAVATRLPGLEAALLGKTAAALAGQPEIWGAHLSDLAPISDVRGSGAYRLEAAGEMCRRVVLATLGEGGRDG